MADEEIKIRLDVDTIEGVQSLSELNEITKDTGDSLGTLEKRAELLKKELAGVKIGTKEFTKLRNELRDTEAQIKDIDLAFESLDFEQRLTAATDTLTGVAGGFAAVQGGIALAGAESEEFEKTMLKVQGAMALAMGVRDVGNAVAAMRKLNLVTKIQTAAQKVLNVVMSANPIVLIATAIGGLLLTFKDVREFIVDKLVGAFNGLKSAVGDVVSFFSSAASSISKAWTSLGSTIGLSSSKISKTISSAADEVEKLAKVAAKAAKERKAQQEAEIKLINQTLKEHKKNTADKIELIDWEMRKRAAAGGDVAKFEKEKLDVIRQSILVEIGLVQKKIDALAEMEGTFSKMQKLGNQRRLNELRRSFQANEQEIEIHTIKQNKIWSDAAKEQAADDQAAFEERRKAEAERTKELTLMSGEEVADIREQQRQKDLEQQQAYYAALGQASAEHSEQQIADEMAVRDAKMDMAGQALAAVAANLEEGSKAAKAVAAAQIIFDTYKGAQSAYATASASPYAIINPAYPAIMASIATAFGVASLRKLMASSTSSTGVGSVSSSTGGATGGVPIAPTAGSTLIDTSGDNQDNRVYVVESDITNTQNGVNAIVSQATI